MNPLRFVCNGVPRANKPLRHRLILPELLLIAGLLFPAFLQAQTSSSGVLKGMVRTEKGGPIPQAHLELIHEPTGSVSNRFAGEDGQYLIVGLRVGGPYRLKVSHIGFGTQVRQGLFFKLLEEVRIDVVLLEADLTTEEVVITGQQGDMLSTQRPGAAVHVAKEQLEALPLPSASFEDAGRLSPYMVNGSALGVNRVYNDVSVDGVGFADQFGLQHVEANIGGMYDNPLTLESIQEIRVDLSPFDVRRSGFTGAAIAALTRSGTNTFSGSLNGAVGGGWWVGRNPDDGRSDFRGFADKRASFRVGGPITESRVFYFVAGEITGMRVPIERKFGEPKTQGTTFSFPAGAVTQFASTLAMVHGYDPGQFDAVFVDRQSANLFTRFDLILSSEHRLSIRYNLLSTRSDRPPHGTTVFASGTLARNSTNVHSVIAEVNSIFGPKVVNELLVSYSGRRFTSTPQGTPFPSVDVIVTDRYGWWNHLTAGSEIGGDGDHLVQDHLEIHNNTSISRGDHLLTVGVQGDIHWFNNDILSYRWGHYIFGSYRDFVAGRPREYEYRYARSTEADNRTRWRAMQFGAFVQDEWTLSPITKVSAGLRVDLPVFPDSPAENSAVHETFFPLGYDVNTSWVPRGQVMVSPRMGVTIVPKADRSIQIRGGIGVFTGRIPYSWIGNLYSNTGLEYVHIKTSATTPAFVADPLRQPKPGSGSPLVETSEVVVISKDFVLPQVVRWTVALDYAFPWNIMGSLEAVYSRTRNGVVFKNINLRPSGTLNAERSGDGRDVYGRSRLLGGWDYARNDDRYTDVMYLSNADAGTSTFLTAQLQCRPDGDGLFASIAYSTGETMDVNSGTWDNAYDQWRYNPAYHPNNPRLDFSAFDRKHRITVAVVYQYDWSPGYSTTIGLVYTGASGIPYSYVYDGDVNGDGESMNDLFYIPARSSEILLADDEGNLLLPDDAAYNLLFGYIAHDDYLSTRRRQVAERNGARTPWTHQLDLRIAQTVPLRCNDRLEIDAEVLNLLNLLNPSWGLVQSVPYQVVPVLRFLWMDPIGRPLFQWSPRTTPLVPDPLLSRWRLRLGMRYSF